MCTILYGYEKMVENIKVYNPDDLKRFALKLMLLVLRNLEILSFRNPCSKILKKYSSGPLRT